MNNNDFNNLFDSKLKDNNQNNFIRITNSKDNVTIKER